MSPPDGVLKVDREPDGDSDGASISFAEQKENMRGWRNIEDVLSSIARRMHGLQPLLAFSETAKRGGFAAAARELGTAPSTLAKAVARLEASLGLRLFYRTTRQVSLTTDGERLFRRCQRVLAELEELQDEAKGARGAPTGTLRVDMPIVFGRRLILPVLAGLIARYPGLGLDARFSDAFVDLVRDGVDVAIRIGDLQDSTLVARRIGSEELLLVASPAYLKGRGTPRCLADLASHRHIVFRQPTHGRVRPQAFTLKGRSVALQSDGLRFNDGEAMAEAALLGLGVTQLPQTMVSDHVESGALAEVLRQNRPPAMPVHAVMPANRMVPARVRVFVDALVEQMEPTRESARRR